MTAAEVKEQSSTVAYLAGGCFWCLEALFARLPGVVKVTSGYMGGEVANPSYQLVCTETTGHAETVKIEFDSEKLSYLELLINFFALHDPTQLNRQGNDVGSRYRSAVFYVNFVQRQEAVELVRVLRQEQVFAEPIVTVIAPAGEFYVAEDIHRQYFANNPGNPYCQLVIKPKIEHMADHIAAVKRRLGGMVPAAV